MVRTDASDSVDLWEWKVPLVLLLIGLLVLIVGAFTTDGPMETVGALIGIAIVLVVQLPLTIAAMYLAARLLSLSYGDLKAAILKLAAIILFTAALNQLGDWLDIPIVGWLVAVAVSFYLFSKLFDLDPMETFLSVLLISVIRFVFGAVIAAVLAALTVGIG